MADDRMDKDRAEGTGKQWTGGAKENVGELVGDEKMKREGQAEKNEGKLQNAWGSAKEKARETFGDDEEEKERR